MADEVLIDNESVGSRTSIGAEHHEVHANDPYAHAFSGTFYELARFGRLRIAIDYYIDGLTLLMF